MSTTSPSLELVVYTDYKSPYAYVASNATLALAREYPIQLKWKPYTLRIAEYLDEVEERSAHNWRKVKYAYMDARRLANAQGLTLMGPRRVYNGSLASIGMLFSQVHGFFDAYHENTFARFWRHDLDIDSLEEMKQHIESLGGSANEFERYAADVGRAENECIVKEAEELGVFGVPAFVFEGELFWGGDRVPMLKSRIESRLTQLATSLRANKAGQA